jgi:predicted DNA-binding transcriptional regulator AlpA
VSRKAKRNKTVAEKIVRAEASAISDPLIAANKQAQHNGLGPHLPPLWQDRLLDRHEVCAITNVTFPTIWAWMRAGKFPRSRIVGGKSMWLSSEVNAWMQALPVRPLKGDSAEAEAQP